MDNTITYDKTCITIRGYYHIYWDQINTPEKLSFFRKHLSEKEWFKDYSKRFEDIIKRRRNENMD